MNFIEWKNEQESRKPIPSNPKTIKTKQERDRLTRMEAMLDELLLLKKVIVEANTFQLCVGEKNFKSLFQIKESLFSGLLDPTPMLSGKETITAPGLA
jgi:hypothetical protein